MRLKEFFLALAKYNQEIEIYYRIEYDGPAIGFKINNIDSNESAIYNNTIHTIHDEIIKFIDASGLISAGEGNTSYFIKPDKTCLKNAEYFDWLFETENDWIKENDTVFVFGEIELPINSISINKNLNDFKIKEGIELNKLVPEKLYENFTGFYKKLLNQFQEMEIELQFDVDNENNTISYINRMKGSYIEEMNFNLLDKSVEDFLEKDLKSLLIESFNIESFVASQILNVKSEI